MKKEALILIAAASTLIGCRNIRYTNRRIHPPTPHRYSSTTHYRSTPRYAPSAHGSPRRRYPGLNPYDPKYTSQDRRKMENYQKNREFEERRRAAQRYFRRKGHKFTPRRRTIRR